MDSRILGEIGLTPGEVKTYLALLKIGLTSSGPLANEAGVSRSKLYWILDKLEKKGLASHVEKNGVTYFQAAEPARVKDFLAEKAKKLGEIEKEFDEFLPKLVSLQSAGEAHKVSVYQGLKGLATAHQHMYLKLKRGEAYYSIGIPSTQPEPHHLFWQRDHERRKRAGIKAKLLFNRDVPREVLKNRNSFAGCDARFMPFDLRTPAYFEIYADTTLIVIPSENPVTIEIISDEIAASFKAYFDEFWRASKPFK
jgi:sugar-specific transcriptional regulator TrmB